MKEDGTIAPRAIPVASQSHTTTHPPAQRGASVHLTPRARSAIFAAMAQKHEQANAKPLAEAPQKAPNGKFKPRISARLRKAIEIMTLEGQPRYVAAQRAGMSDSAVYQALRRPHVRSLMRQMLDDMRENEAVRAYFRQVNLAETASSEDVRQKTNAWIAGCAGLAPVQKVQGTHHVTHAFEGIGFADAVDVTPDSGGESSS